MAVPMTSCMSDPIMATSVHSHSARRGRAGYCLQFKQKFRLVFSWKNGRYPVLGRYRTFLHKISKFGSRDTVLDPGLGLIIPQKHVLFSKKLKHEKCIKEPEEM